MNFIKCDIPGLILIEPNVMADSRGLFTKVFTRELFLTNNLDLDVAETYYTISSKGVIRGMHFQVPPMDHNKLVYVTKGSVMDVVLDIRKGSPTYGKYFNTILNDENRNIMYIPKGCAHGFKALTDEACIFYNQSTVYSPECDSGILYNSFGFDWDITSPPNNSERDMKFVFFKDFSSPFIYKPTN